MLTFEFPSLQQPQSPLQHSQEIIKTYFQNLKTFSAQENKLPNFDFGFEEKISPKNCCTEILKPNDKYYFCQNCLTNSLSNDKMIFCSGCFDSSRHEGHQFVEKTVKLYARVSCDCGRISRLKKESFCDSHNSGTNKLEVNIEEDKRFRTTFEELFEILFFVEENENEERANLLRELIISSLVNLSRNSLYYTRQIQILFDQKVKIGETPVLLKKQILKTAEYQDLILQLLGDFEYLLSFGRYFCELEMSGVMLFQFGHIKKELFSSYDFIRNLGPSEVEYYSSEDLIHTKFSEILNSSEGDKTQPLQDLFQKIQSSLIPNIIAKFVQNNQSIIKTDEILAQFLFEKILDLGIEQLEMKVNESPIKNERPRRRDTDGLPETLQERIRGEEERARVRESLSKISPQNIISLFKIIVNMIFLKSDQSFEGLRQTTKTFLQEERVEQKACTFLDILINNKAIEIYSIESERNLKALAVLTIFCSFDQREKTSVSLFWETTLKRKFTDILRISNIAINGLIDLYKLFPSLAYSSKEFLNLNQNEKTRKVFKSWLAHKGRISRTELLSEFMKGWIPISCLEIVNESCNLTRERTGNRNEERMLTSKKNLKAEEKDIILLLSTESNKSNFLEIKLPENSSHVNKNLQEILGVFFSFKYLGPFFEKLEEFLSSPSGDKNDQIVEYFSFLNKLEKVGGIEEISKVYEQIISNENLKKKIIENTFEHRLLIRKLLKVSNEEQEENVNTEAVDRENEKKIIQQKCKNMKERLRKAWNVADEPTSVGILDENDPTSCILCKGSGKMENHLIYLANVTKNNVISQRIHGKSSLSSTYFKSELHAMHIECFKKQAKNNLGFRCIHCNEHVNCALPYKVRNEEIFLQDYEFCQRVVEGALMCQFNDYSTNLFEIIFDSLLESLGIVEIIFSNRENVLEKRKAQKDKYLLVMLTSIYEGVQNKERAVFDQVFEKYLRKTEDSDKTELKLFQNVIIKALKRAIQREDPEEENLEVELNELKRILFENEFAVLENKLNFIKNFNSESENECSSNKQKEKITETTEPIQEKKSLKFNILRLPERLKDLQALNFNQELPSRNCPCGGSQTEKLRKICLLCKKVFCTLCEADSAHRESHEELVLDIHIETGRLEYSVPGAGEPGQEYCYLNHLFFSSAEMRRQAGNDSENIENKQVMDQLKDQNNFKFNESPVQHFESLLFGMDGRRREVRRGFRGHPFMDEELSD